MSPGTHGEAFEMPLSGNGRQHNNLKTAIASHNVYNEGPDTDCCASSGRQDEMQTETLSCCCNFTWMSFWALEMEGYGGKWRSDLGIWICFRACLICLGNRMLRAQAQGGSLSDLYILLCFYIPLLFSSCHIMYSLAFKRVCAVEYGHCKLTSILVMNTMLHLSLCWKLLAVRKAEKKDITVT